MLWPKHSTYQVKRGDTLWRIAAREYGDTSVWPEIEHRNRLSFPRRLLIGMTLNLPAIHRDPEPHLPHIGLGSHIPPAATRSPRVREPGHPHHGVRRPNSLDAHNTSAMAKAMGVKYPAVTYNLAKKIKP